MINLELGDVAHIIQLSIAPVFLLTGVGTLLTVLTNRLARILDRSRILEEQLAGKGGVMQKPGFREELSELYERGHLINWAITLATMCGLFICMVIASLFLGDAAGWKLDTLIAGFFVAGVFSLIGSFIYLLREIFVATKTLKRQRKQGRRKME